jgi:hypothetical protein
LAVDVHPSGDVKQELNWQVALAIVPDESPVVDEKLWDAWLQKCERRERRTARRIRIIAGTLACLVAVTAASFYALR